MTYAELNGRYEKLMAMPKEKRLSVQIYYLAQDFLKKSNDCRMSESKRRQCLAKMHNLEEAYKKLTGNRIYF